jgi:hypothetical protein
MGASGRRGENSKRRNLAIGERTPIRYIIL